MPWLFQCYSVKRAGSRNGQRLDKGFEDSAVPGGELWEEIHRWLNEPRKILIVLRPAI